MAITTQERTNILKLTVGMFNAAPGAKYLAEFASVYEAGGHNLAALASTLNNNGTFVNLYPNFLTGKEFATKFLSTLNLQNNQEAMDYVVAKYNAGVPKTQIILDALVAIDATTSPAFAEAQAILVNKAAVAENYSVTLNASAESLATLQGTLANVTANPASVTAANAANAGGNGQAFTLTAGVDIKDGTAGNDTFIADNTGTTKQLGAVDQINGGAGTDTLKVFMAATDTATGQPTLTNIENVWLNGGAVTAYTAATGTTGLTVEAPAAAANAAYTVNGQAVTLINHNVGTAAVTTTVTQAAAATATAQSVTLNGVTSTTGVHTLDIAGAKVTTLDLATTGAASKIALTGAAVTTLNVTGSAGLTVTAAPATITTVNAAAATGAVSYAAGTAAAAFKFTGGSANDTVSFANDGLAALTSGAQLVGGAGTGDKIGILDTALSATETARINQATGFEVLGLNASIILDASTLTAIKSFAVDTAATTSVINSLATGSTTAINASTTSLTLGTAVGVTDTAITIGGTAGGVTATALVTTGITNVTVTSNGTTANVVTGLTNSDNSVFTIKGAAALTLGLAAGTAVGSKIDGSAATGILTLTGSALAGSGDIIIGGSAADVINGGKGADTLTGGAGADTFVFTTTTGVNASGAAFGQADVITDFVVGTDKIQFSTTEALSGQQVAVQAAVTALAAGATAAQIATAMATASTTDLGVSVATFGGNTYVLYETSGAGVGVAIDDAFIQLTGVASGFTFANSVVA